MLIKGLSRRNQLIAGAVALALLGIGGLLYYLYIYKSVVSIDSSLQKALDGVSGVTEYSQNVDTQVDFADRRLLITGIYEVHSQKKIYAAYSTTTLSIKGDPIGHTFTHQNIAVGDEVYTKVETHDALLKSSIQSSPTWHHFTATTIPQAFVGIAIPGAIQDNLQILSDNGSWLTLIKKAGLEHMGTNSYLRYTFKLSGKTPPDGPLSGVMSRIGSDGVVDIWIDPHDSKPYYLRFANSTYVSTTTILYDTSLLPVGPPEEPHS